MADTAKDAALAQPLLGLLDLTPLYDRDDGEVVRALTAYAATPLLPAAQIMLDVIDGARMRGVRVGFKASGGIRTMSAALSYLAAYEQRFGAHSAQPAEFRIGASHLVHELLAVAGAERAIKENA